jgi:hypothetical protein
MVAVVHGPRGTARASGAGARWTIAGKTGTSQVIGIAQGEDYDERARWMNAIARTPCSSHSRLRRRRASPSACWSKTAPAAAALPHPLRARSSTPGSAGRSG